MTHNRWNVLKHGSKQQNNLCLIIGCLNITTILLRYAFENIVQIMHDLIIVLHSYSSYGCIMKRKTTFSSTFPQFQHCYPHHQKHDVDMLPVRFQTPENIYNNSKLQYPHQQEQLFTLQEYVLRRRTVVSSPTRDSSRKSTSNKQAPTTTMNQHNQHFNFFHENKKSSEKGKHDVKVQQEMHLTRLIDKPAAPAQVLLQQEDEIPFFQIAQRRKSFFLDDHSSSSVSARNIENPRKNSSNCWILNSTSPHQHVFKRSRTHLSNEFQLFLLGTEGGKERSNPYYYY